MGEVVFIVAICTRASRSRGGVRGLTYQTTARLRLFDHAGSSPTAVKIFALRNLLS
jgi:hypothetical protein